MKRQVYIHARKNSNVHGRYFREKDISVVGHEDIRLYNLYMYEYVAAETRILSLSDMKISIGGLCMYE